MANFTVVFYEKEDGTRPAHDYIKTLSDKMRARIYKIADVLEMIGPQARMPYSEHLEDGIFKSEHNRRETFLVCYISSLLGKQ